MPTPAVSPEPPCWWDENLAACSDFHILTGPLARQPLSKTVWRWVEGVSPL